MSRLHSFLRKHLAGDPRLERLERLYVYAAWMQEQREAVDQELADMRRTLRDLRRMDRQVRKLGKDIKRLGT